MKRALYYWKTIAWALIMLIIFLLPANNLSKAPHVHGLSEMIHIFMFGVFAGLFILEKYNAASLNIPARRNYITTIATCLVFGIIIELMQKFSGFGRTAEIMDVVFDLAGSLISAVGIAIYFRKRGHGFVKF